MNIEKTITTTDTSTIRIIKILEKVNPSSSVCGFVESNVSVVYQNNRHVGFNETTSEIETEIPGSYYQDFENITFIMLPENITDFKVVVDAQQAHEPLETYELVISTVKDDELVDEIIIEDAIEQKEKQDFNVELDPSGKMQPILRTFYPEWEETEYLITIESNATVKNFNFSQPDKQIRFNITEVTEKVVFCNITIPKELMWVDDLREWNVTIDDTTLGLEDRIITENSTHYYIFFEPGSGVCTMIASTHVIPEFSSYLMLMFLVATLIATTIHTKKRRQKLKS